MEALFLKKNRALFLSHGDTNSTLAAALAAVKLHIPVAHVEATRMNDKTIPEEVNRVITDHISSILFAPTPTCQDNLYGEGLTEGVSDRRCYAGLLCTFQRKQKSTRILDDLGIEQNNYLLATVHRASNTDTKETQQEICKAFIELAKEIKLVFPVHLQLRSI